MGAFDPLFRGRRRLLRRRAATGMMGGSKIGSVLGLAGIGYAAYRFLQTERGRAVQSNVVEQVRNFGERVRAHSGDLSTRWAQSHSSEDLGESQL